MVRIAAAAPGLLGMLGLLAWVSSARPLEITPSAWDTGDWIEALVIGSPIAAPDSISLRGPESAAIAAVDPAVAGDSLRFFLDLRQAAVGWYDLRLATGSGDVHVEPQCFEVRPLAPHPAWLEPVRLTEEPEASERPALAVDLGQRVHVVWQNGRGADSGTFDIQYRRMAGGAWTATEVLSDAGG